MDVFSVHTDCPALLTLLTLEGKAEYKVDVCVHTDCPALLTLLTLEGKANTKWMFSACTQTVQHY